MQRIYFVLLFILLFVAPFKAQPLKESSLAKFVTALPNPNTCDINDKKQAILFVKNVGLYKCLGGTYVAVEGAGGGGGGGTELGMADSADYGNSLSAAIAAIGADPVRLKITGPTTATANATVPKNIPVSFGELGYLTVGDGLIVKIENGLGLIASSDKSIFRGAGKVQFTGSYPEKIFPAWFGAVGDQTADDTTAFQKIYDSFQFTRDNFRILGGGTVVIPCGRRYKITDTIIIRNTTHTVGGGGGGIRACGLVYYTGTQKPLFLVHGVTTETGLNENDPLNRNNGVGSTFERFTIEGNQNPDAQIFDLIDRPHVVNTTTDAQGNMILTRVSGPAFNNRAHYKKGLTVVIGDTVYVIKDYLSPDSITLAPVRLGVLPVGDDMVAMLDNHHTDPSWVGQTVIIDNISYTIVGLAENSVFANVPEKKYFRIDRTIESIARKITSVSIPANSTQITINSNQALTKDDENRAVYIGGVFYGSLITVINGSTATLSIQNGATAVVEQPANLKGFDFLDGRITTIKTLNDRPARFGLAAGIEARTRINVKGMYLTNLAGNGVTLNSDVDPTGNAGAEPNVNYSVIENNAIYTNFGNGVYMNGLNGNTMTFTNNDISNNQGWGTYDNGFLGSTIIAGHWSFNRYGAIYANGLRSLLVGTYEEGGQASSVLENGSFYIGGNHAPGISDTEGHNIGIKQPNNGKLLTSSLQVIRKPNKDDSGNEQPVISSFFGAPLSTQAGETQSTALAGFGAGDDQTNINNTYYLEPTWVWTYGKGGIGNGWLSFDYDDLKRSNANNSIFAVSGSQAAEGAKQFWLPRGFFVGQTATGGRTKVDTDTKGVTFDKNIAAPSVQLSVAGRPDCDITTRGTLYFARATGATADQMQFCGRLADSTYAWTGLATATTTITPASVIPDTNWALTSNGGTATATSTLNGSYPPSGTINGNRTGSDLGAGGTWNSVGIPTDANPQYLTVTFSQPRNINEIGVISLRDNDSITSAAPVTTTETGSQNLATKFDVQYWDGSAWQTVEQVVGNTKIWHQSSFETVTTTQIRIAVKAVGANYQAYLAEVEAWFRN